MEGPFCPMVRRRATANFTENLRGAWLLMAVQFRDGEVMPG
jgi:hypothetical protein